jgi:hypothetical protein
MSKTEAFGFFQRNIATSIFRLTGTEIAPECARRSLNVCSGD